MKMNLHLVAVGGESRWSDCCSAYMRNFEFDLMRLTVDLRSHAGSPDCDADAATEPDSFVSSILNAVTIDDYDYLTVIVDASDQTVALATFDYCFV